jgi:predicted GIY-YIG superfamily endonuclease
VKTDKECYVYFIQAGRGPVKVGYTSNVKQRLENMQVGSPDPLSVVFTAGPMSKMMAQAVEKDLHSFFRCQHLRGEWFKKTIIPKLKNKYWQFLADGYNTKITAR